MKNLPSPRLFLILTIIQALHSLEEILTRLYDKLPLVTGQIHNSIELFPVMNMSATTFTILNIIIVSFLAVICVYVYKGKRRAWKAVKIAAFAEILNGILHISAAVYTGGYFPGAISAAGLLVVGILLVRATSGIKILGNTR